MLIGIRREDKSPWEKRVPIVPEDLCRLRTDHGVRFRVQPSPRRVFTDAEFAAAGAEVVEDLSPCPVILGVKEMSPAFFAANKAYMFFSHTIKGQTYNRAMLRRLVELNCSIVDYELITDDSGRRLVFFGRFAGLAGMIDTLWSVGQRLEALGRTTPLAAIAPAHCYACLADARRQITEAAQATTASGALRGLGPFVCGFAGYGHVSRGAQEIYDLCNPTEVSPEELLSLDAGQWDGRFVKVVFREEHMVEPATPDGPFELQEYYAHPEKYRAAFRRYLPHLSVLVNCIFWTSRYPRLVTRADVAELYGAGRTPRLLVIGDISCDVEGSVECTVKATDPGNPVFVYDAQFERAVDGFAGQGPVILAVDALPTELPREASEEFSRALFDFIPALARGNPQGSLEQWDLPGPLQRAVVLHQGHFTPRFEYMREFLAPEISR